MASSNTPVVVAILVAGGLIGGAILFTQPKPPAPPKPDPFQNVKTAVAAKMFDPGSATFQALSELVPDFAYCGEVNAKNKMGGYVGYQKFYAQRDSSGGWIVSVGPPIAVQMCK
jgi:hypothetical protein